MGKSGKQLLWDLSSGRIDDEGGDGDDDSDGDVGVDDDGFGDGDDERINTLLCLSLTSI